METAFSEQHRARTNFRFFRMIQALQSFSTEYSACIGGSPDSGLGPLLSVGRSATPQRGFPEPVTQDYRSFFGIGVSAVRDGAGVRGTFREAFCSRGIAEMASGNDHSMRLFTR
ncbi:hypothetical protein [Roseinatronobacter alkalisoli]|uniref:Uncharacterized protein n=1 Tax=Roseinatronobacter alkalisoli TaxID=3028235 RepID=A0ABT5TE42_9RHOB|nr:hypothetical protein [Roseinatronobacter sp. HJB301]MDD7973394.1 hypothetical protein [Roseinatronobacter sp. HJB301]